MRSVLGKEFALSEEDVREVEGWLRENAELPRTPPVVDTSWWPMELVPLVRLYGPEEVVRAVIAVLKEEK